MFYKIVIEQFSKSLTNLSQILEKTAKQAEAKKVDFTVLLNTRLIADQFSLLRQVQIACDTAKLAAARLAGKEAPVHEDNEASISEIQERIASVVTYLKSYSQIDFDAAADRKITQPRWEGKYLTGEEYLLNHAIPNIYFHITTAYAILRSNGFEIGKKDYLGELPYKI
ncbi:DUF1993 domain-containing protein [Leptospira ognonensis]|uniref:DUF1993 domain-containing protein n=1 Tax=Leptospira ognonensis TaxID=2484945 RepID=A0A4R9KBM1_9LEPT|nr:DUF1993 domain-containing protein [Leptospira ognonensis]TGL62224.1 DUF1993 domain-containing protein [Leptospira ognonensis]